MSSLVWVTNNAPPYRRPLWSAIAENILLRVILLADDSGLERETRRGADWLGASLQDEDRYEHQFAKTARLSRGESSYFILRESPRSIIDDATHVLFGGWESPAYWQLLWAVPSRARKVGFYESTLLSSRHASGPVAAVRRAFYRSMDAVVVPGPAAEDAVLAMGVRPQNIYTGFNCVDMQPFLAVAESTTDTHARGGHRFLYLGQLIERKNVHTLLHSFARARADEDTLIIAGDGADRPRLLRLTEELGLYGSVHFAGHLPYTDLPSLMASADTLVLPSTEEVWGLVVNEALAAGCQVVVSTAAGVSRSVQRMTGVFVAEPTTDAMSDAMRDAKRQHSGRIQSPEIAAHDAAAFAGVFSDALRIERQSQ